MKIPFAHRESLLMLLFSGILLGILLLQQQGPGLSKHVAQAGYLNLKSWTPNKAPVLSIGGEWYLEHAEFSGMAPVKQSWEARTQQLMPTTMPGTYRLHLDFSEAAVGRILKLYAPQSYPFFEIYANGQRVARSGDSITGPAVASRMQSYIPFVLEQTHLELRVDLTPVGEVMNGLRGPLHLGLAEAIDQEISIHRLNNALALGGIGMLLLYYLVIYSQRRELSVLLFCGICLTTICYVDNFHAHLFEKLFGAIPLSWSLRVQRLTMYYNLPVSLLYVSTLFRVPFVPGSARAMTAACLVLISSLLLPMRWMSAAHWVYYACFLIMFPCMAWMIYQAYRQKRENLNIYLFSYLILMATYIYDSLHYLRLVSGPALIPWGLFFFCLAQSTILAQRFNRDYHLAHQLAQELENTNQSLEQTVAERTLRLAEQKQELERLAEFKERVMRMLLHDLKTPLSLLRNLETGVSEAAQTAAEEMERMLVQLQTTEDLSVPQLPSNLSSLCLRDALERALRLYQLWISEYSIRIVNEVAPEIKVRADADLLVRVLHNLLSNALKSIGHQGVIQLLAITEKDWVQLDIVDSGHGFNHAPQTDPMDMGVSHFDAAHSQGIGLAYCQLAVETQGGHISWHNLEQGACVRLRLRRVPSLAVETLTLKDAETLLARNLYDQLDSLAFYELSALLRVIESYRSHAQGDWLNFLQALHHSIENADENEYFTLKERLHRAYPNR